MSKHSNPYRDGSAYSKIFAFIQKAGVVTRKMLLAKGFAVADVTVVLSPRDASQTRKGADCRGNMSAQGHVYFMEKLNKVKGEAQRFRLRWRSKELAKHVRPPQKEVKSQKAKAKTAPKRKTAKRKAKAPVAAAPAPAAPEAAPIAPEAAPVAPVASETPAETAPVADAVTA